MRVTDQSAPLPQRIGDAERDRAAEFLRDHLAEGRLDQAEFDERLTRALTAKTQADLDPLFQDLPGPKPGSTAVPADTFQAPPWQRSAPSQGVAPRPAAPAPVSARANNAWAFVSAVAWPVAIILCFATHWSYWWIILIPIFFSGWVGQGRRHDHRRPGR
jgi:hypothetical protein